MAFTLLELLTVIALMAVMMAGLGWRLRAPTGSVALQAAQGMLARGCDAARGRAVLAAANVRLVVSADPADADGALRWWQMVEEDGANPGRWLATGGGFWLPRGVYTVPPAGVDLPGNPDWPAARRSSALSATAQSMVINGSAAGLCYYVQFSPRGTTGGGTVVLAAGHAEANAAGWSRVLENADAVRGVLLRPSGAFTLINDAGALGP